MNSVSDFFSWWLAELRSLLPRRLRGDVDNRRTLLIEVGGDSISASQLDGDARESLLTVARGAIAAGADDGPAAGEGALAARAAAAARSGARVVVRIDASLVLTRPVELPAAAAENLREVLTFELHRLTPFHDEDVHFEFRALGPSRDGQSLAVELRIVRRAVLEQVYALLAPHPFRPRGQVALDDSGEGDLCLLLAPEQEDDRRASWLGRALWAANAALLAAVILLPLGQLDERIAALRAEVAAARSGADAVVALHEQADALAERRAALIALKRDTVPRIEILRELTERIPDSAWIQRMEVDDDEVVVHGLADAASPLIALVEESPLFASPRFPSPVTRNAASGNEQFRLAVQVAPREQP